MSNDFNQGHNRPKQHNLRGRAQNPQTSSKSELFEDEFAAQKTAEPIAAQQSTPEKQVYPGGGFEFGGKLGARQVQPQYKQTLSGVAQKPQNYSQPQNQPRAYSQGGGQSYSQQQAQRPNAQRVSQNTSQYTRVQRQNIESPKSITQTDPRYKKPQEAEFLGARTSARSVPQAGGTAGYARKSSQSKKSYAALIIFLVLAIIVVGVFAGYNIISNRISGENTDLGKLSDDYKTLPEYKGKGIINILVCGIDYDNEGANGYVSQDKIGRTDMIMYVHYDTVANKANILQIPRDTFVGADVRTGGTYKINSLFYSAEDTENRMNALAEVINDQFKLPVDYYLTIDLDSMKKLVEVVGNINVYVPYDITDPKNGITLQEGWRVLDPDTAEFFVRNRTSPNYNQQGDIMRMQTQLNFYSALFRLIKTLTPQDMIKWGEIFLYYVKTDMTPMDILGLLQKVLKIEGEDITLVRLPCGAANYKGQSVVAWEAQESAELLNRYFRPEGESYSAEQLNIKELPMNVGIVPASIKSMASIEADAPPMPEDFRW